MKYKKLLFYLYIYKILKTTQQFTKTEIINMCLTIVREIPNINSLDIQEIYRTIDTLSSIFQQHPTGMENNRKRNVNKC